MIWLAAALAIGPKAPPPPEAVPAAVPAEPEPRPPSPSTAPAAGIGTPLRTGARHPDDAAVVIGIEDYAFLPDVPYAERDAQVMEDLFIYTLGVPYDRVQRLGAAASREQILAAVDEAASLVGPDGTLWLYYAGHGAASPSTGERVLLGVDTMANATSFEARAVPIASLKEAAVDVHRTVLLVDACYAGASRAGQELLAGKRFAVPAYVKPDTGGWVEWNAAQPNELSGPFEPAQHGAFTFAVAGALRGWADGQLSGTPDGVITLEEAQLFVGQTLRTVDVRDQRPDLAALDLQAALATLPVGTLEAPPSPEALRRLAQGGPPVPATSTPTPGTQATPPDARPDVAADDGEWTSKEIQAAIGTALLGGGGRAQPSQGDSGAPRSWGGMKCRPDTTQPSVLQDALWFWELGVDPRASWNCGGMNARLLRFPSTNGKAIEQLLVDNFLSATTRVDQKHEVQLQAYLPNKLGGPESIHLEDVSTWPTFPIQTPRGAVTALAVPMEVWRGKKSKVSGPWLIVEDDRDPGAFFSCHVWAKWDPAVRKCTELLQGVLSEPRAVAGVVR